MLKCSKKVAQEKANTHTNFLTYYASELALYFSFCIHSLTDVKSIVLQALTHLTNNL